MALKIGTGLSIRADGLKTLDTTIAAVSAEPLDLPLLEPFTIATGSVSVARNVLIRVELASGSVGLGEAALFPGVHATQAAVLDSVESIHPALTGMDAGRWRQASQQISASDEVARAALCGLEMAILDAWTRYHEMPLWKFFGGRQTKLCTDMTVTAGDTEQAANAAQNIHGRGIATMKIKIGALSPAKDAERVIAIRDAVPAARLFVDANGGYDAAGAIGFLDDIRAAGIELEAFEQPVPRDDWQGLGRVKSRSNIPIFADESACDAADVVRIAKEGLADGINIKVMKSGVVGAVGMWELARAHGLELMIGGMVESILAMSFSANLAAGLGGFRLADLDTPMFVEKHPFTGGYLQEGELLTLSEIDCGHGVQLA